MFKLLVAAQLANTAIPVNTADPTAALMLPLVLILGFVAAAGIGSIAWYNSKRPTGWEDKERPAAIPKLDTPNNPEP